MSLWLAIPLGVLGLYCLLVWCYVLFVGREHAPEWKAAPGLAKFLTVFMAPVTFPVFLVQEIRKDSQVMEEAQETLGDWGEVMDKEDALECETMEVFRNYLRSPAIKDREIKPPVGEFTLTTPLEIHCSGCVLDFSETLFLTDLYPAVKVFGSKNCLGALELIYPSEEGLMEVSPVAEPESGLKSFVEASQDSFTLLVGLAIGVKESNE